MISGNEKTKALSSARIASVQSLYEMEIAGASIDSVTVDFLNNRWSDDRTENDHHEPNKTLYNNLMIGVQEKKTTLDCEISLVISNVGGLERLDVLMKVILRAGAYELLEELLTPSAVIIDEYVEITKSFYFSKEPGFVNG
ncbi:MAG: transcription antitermination factor NusB, partial [Pseudomonadota bacterium]|nr:transcription antitermination factor NusB [Pseudomonadota bacterium]